MLCPTCMFGGHKDFCSGWHIRTDKHFEDNPVRGALEIEIELWNLGVILWSIRITLIQFCWHDVAGTKHLVGNLWCQLLKRIVQKCVSSVSGPVAIKPLTLHECVGNPPCRFWYIQYCADIEIYSDLIWNWLCEDIFEGWLLYILWFWFACLIPNNFLFKHCQICH